MKPLQVRLGTGGSSEALKTDTAIHRSSTLHKDLQHREAQPRLYRNAQPPLLDGTFEQI